MADTPPPPRPPAAARGTVAKSRQQRADLSPELVVAYFRQMEQEQRNRTMLGLAAGVAASLFAPVVFTIFFYIISTTLIASYGFLVTYLIVATVSLPVLFAIAYFMGGSMVERADERGVFDNPFTRGRIGALFVVADVANIGPRLTLWAVYRLRHRAGVGVADLPRVAAAVVTLAAHDAGVKPAALVAPGEPPDALEPVLAYLLHFDVVDVSSRGDRVWLTTPAKAKLGLPA